jgi:two-component system invasion response regulator UvrY
VIHVVVVADHPIVREGLKRIIAENIGMAVAGEAGDGQEALRIIRNGPCDVVLLDLAIPQKSGLQVLKDLRSENPRLPVLILNSSSEDQSAVRCIRAGAAGCLPKETALREVIPAIQKVAGGGKYFSEKLAEKLVFNHKSNKQPLHEALSDREYEVFCMIASGKTVSQIAKELGLSVKTVSTYRIRILEKLMMANNAELMHYAISEGLVN